MAMTETDNPRPGSHDLPRPADAMLHDAEQRIIELERRLSDSIRERDEAQAHRRLLLDTDLTARTLVEQETELKRVGALVERLREALQTVAPYANQLLPHVEEAVKDALADAPERRKDILADVDHVIDGLAVTVLTGPMPPAPIGPGDQGVWKDAEGERS